MIYRGCHASHSKCFLSIKHPLPCCNIVNEMAFNVHLRLTSKERILLFSILWNVWQLNWRKGKEVLFRKVLAFVLIRQQEGSYAGSHRAMAKDISSSCLCECQGQKQQILFLSSSQGRDDQTASLKRAILLLRFESECYFLPRNVAYSLHCHRKVHCLQLSIVQVLTKGSREREG